MMKILFGVQGTGNGHISRSKILVSALRKRGMSVDVLISGREEKDLWGIESLKPYTVKNGLTFYVENGKINRCRTVAKLKLRQFWKDVKNLDLSHYDLVISDYEPISAWAAKEQRVLSIGISHQCSFMYNVPKPPGKYLEGFILNRFAPVNIPIGLHWNHFGGFILPPIIDRIIKGNSSAESILVYLPFESPDTIRKILSPFKDMSFYIYGHDSLGVRMDNAQWKPTSRNGFLKDLKKCTGVICNAGFELPSEAISLGKKVLVKPVDGQVEQESNALAMELLGLGNATNELSEKAFDDWISSERKGTLPYFNVAEPIVDWIESWQFNDVGGLVEYVWGY